MDFVADYVEFDMEMGKLCEDIAQKGRVELNDQEYAKHLLVSINSMLVGKFAPFVEGRSNDFIEPADLFVLSRVHGFRHRVCRSYIETKAYEAHNMSIHDVDPHRILTLDGCVEKTSLQNEACVSFVDDTFVMNALTQQAPILAQSLKQYVQHERLKPVWSGMSFDERKAFLLGHVGASDKESDVEGTIKRDQHFAAMAEDLSQDMYRFLINSNLDDPSFLLG